MRIRNRFLTLCIAVLSLGLLIAAAAPENDPMQLLQFVANNMIDALKANHATLKSNPQVVYDIANRYVVPYADLPDMSRRVLPPNIWNSSTEAQRQQFQKAFTTTLIRTYASALASYKDQTIKFFPIRGGFEGKDHVEVNSEIDNSNGSTINVTYMMIRKGNVWRLIDLSVDGVDMLDSFRAQFADILSNGNMDQLLKRMTAHNDRKV